MPTTDRVAWSCHRVTNQRQTPTQHHRTPHHRTQHRGNDLPQDQSPAKHHNFLPHRGHKTRGKCPISRHKAALSADKEWPGAAHLSTRQHVPGGGRRAAVAVFIRCLAINRVRGGSSGTGAQVLSIAALSQSVRRPPGTSPSATLSPSLRSCPLSPVPPSLPLLPLELRRLCVLTETAARLPGLRAARAYLVPEGGGGDGGGGGLPPTSCLLCRRRSCRARELFTAGGTGVTTRHGSARDGTARHGMTRGVMTRDTPPSPPPPSGPSDALTPCQKPTDEQVRPSRDPT